MSWETLGLSSMAGMILILSFVTLAEAFTDLQKLRDPPLDARSYWTMLFYYLAIVLTLWVVAYLLYQRAGEVYG